MSQRVLVTAGASGLGLAMVRRFRADGARVALCDIDGEAVDRVLGQDPDLIAETLDVTDEGGMARLFARMDQDWGGIDVLCANAGTGGPAGPIEDLDYAGWKACLSANLDGGFLAAREAASRMKAQASGLMIFTASTAGQWGYPLRSPYATAKWGVIGLMKTLAQELGPSGVRVNALCPGSVEGDRMDRVVANEAAARGVAEDEVRASYVKGVSMKTWISAEEIAEMAAYLASPLGARISGQAIAIDGGTESLNAWGEA